jgi:hypothetical protein
MNLKIGGIAAAAGFVLSLSIGLVFGNGVFAVPRAFAFALFFFVLVNAILFITRRFLPELLDIVPEPGDSRPGSLINIVEGNETANSPDMGADIENLDFRQGPDGGGDLAVEPDLSGERFSDGNGPGGGISGPLDLTGKDSYNEESSVPGADAGLREDRADGASAGVLSDIELMSRAFLTPDGKAGEAGNGTEDPGGDVFHLSVAGQSPEPSTGYYTGNKPVELEGDFPPKKIAQAIQTILKRDE